MPNTMTSEDTITKMLNSCKKSTDKRHIYKNLIEIRANVKSDTQIDLFNRTDGVRLCVDLIKKPHEQILDVALSILGNCCTKKEGCEKAHEAGILPSLMSALKGLKNLSIQCRVCRVLGSLAEHKRIASHIYDFKPAFGLCSLLEPTNGIPVLLMAVRAIRILCSDKKFQDECVVLGVVKKTVHLLVQNTLASNVVEEEAFTSYQSDTVVIKRMHSPDRTITKQKFERILDDIEHSRTDITGYEFVKTTQLQQNSRKFVMPEKKGACELITGILRFLQVVTKAAGPQVACQISSTDGNGYPCLLFLGSQEASPFRTLVLKIISNLVEQPDGRRELTICDAVTVAADILLSKQENTAGDDAERKCCENWCVKIICLLAESAGNRLKIRQSGVFNYLLEKMKTAACEQEQSLIFYGLNQFRYDNSGLIAMTENGVISTLIKILAEKLDKEQAQHSPCPPKATNSDSKPCARSKDRPASQKKRNLELSPTATRFAKLAKFDYYEPDSAGSSSSGYVSCPYPYQGPSSPLGSSYSYSPASTPPRILDNDEDFDSEKDYSPVCSDNEGDEDQAPPEKSAEIANFDIFKLIGIDISDNSAAVDDENSCFAVEEREATAPNDLVQGGGQDEPKLETVKEFESNPIMSLLTLVWTISNLKPDHPDFVKVTTLKTLLRVCCTSRNPDGKAGKILVNVVSQINNFLKIIQQDFIFDLDALVRSKFEHGECVTCDEMTVVGRKLLGHLGVVAQSGYGRGEIAHFLAKKTTDDNVDMQKRMACITTYIINEPKMLYQLLFQANVLDTVLAIIFEDEVYANAAAVGLTMLATNLNIKISGEISTASCSVAELSEPMIENDVTEEVITFHLKDEHQFRIAKSLLTDNSDVFSCMLRGDFREGQQNEVHLPETSLGGIRYFCKLVRLSATNELTQAPRPDVFSMPSVLEAFDLSIKYMLADIEAAILTVIKAIMHDSSVLKVFEWSLRNMNRPLLDTAVAYFLNCDITGERKVALYRQANQSSFKLEWRQLIVDTIFNKCSPGLE